MTLTADQQSVRARPKHRNGFWGQFLTCCAIVLVSACSAQRDAASRGELPALSYGGNIAFGLPGGTGVILDKGFFVLLFDTTTLVPRWVSYRLTKGYLQGSAERTDDFRHDPELPAGGRQELEDYRSSGYDRGHMAPAADFVRSREAMSATFLLSNMAPQRPALNRGIWAQLESEIRILAESHGTLWILTGGMFLDSLEQPARAAVFIGPDSVGVPSHFFKVILCEHPDGTKEMFAFVMANSFSALPGKPKEYMRSVDDVEQLSGLDFFSGMNDETEELLERAVAVSWVGE